MSDVASALANALAAAALGASCTLSNINLESPASQYPHAASEHSSRRPATACLKLKK